MPPGWEYEVQYIDVYVYINSFSWDKSLIESKECYYQHPAIINNKAREKYFKNNKAINYGHEKAISFLKLLYKSSVWLKLYMLKWSQVTPPPSGKMYPTIFHSNFIPSFDIDLFTSH